MTSLTSIVLRGEEDEPIGHARYSPASGWLWSCALCPDAPAHGSGAAAPDYAVAGLVDHIERRHL